MQHIWFMMNIGPLNMKNNNVNSNIKKQYLNIYSFINMSDLENDSNLC